MELCKKIGEALMTNRLKFRIGNIGHACYFAVGALLSNFCYSFNNPLGTFKYKMESLQKWENVLRIGEEGENIMAAR